MNKEIINLIQTYQEQLIPLYGNYTEVESIILWMLSSIVGKSRLELLSMQEPLTQQHKNVLKQWIDEHTKYHKPLAYLMGSVPFIDCTIFVESPVLIPRPETEEWVFDLIKKLQKLSNKKITILDLCTGSGAIACALAHALPEAAITAADISKHALEITKKNAAYNNVSIRSMQSDLFSSLQGQRFDLIVTNPPYISAEVWHSLDPMVKEWEDYNALVAPNEGLGLIYSIIEQAPHYLRENTEMRMHDIPSLFCEIGYDQAEVVQQRMNTFLCKAKVLTDYCGKNRVVTGFLI